MPVESPVLNIHGLRVNAESFQKAMRRIPVNTPDLATAKSGVFSIYFVLVNSLDKMVMDLMVSKLG